MKNHVLWVVGEPGAGKTTFVRELIRWPRHLVEKPKWTLVDEGRIVLAGHYTGGTFDGADTVPYNGVAAALEFWREMLAKKAQLTVFDGDRFSNKTALSFMASQPGVELHCLLLTVPPEVAAARRQGRGGGQNESWVKGRKTKSERFAREFPNPFLEELGPTLAPIVSTAAP